jgi:hypothetical protein
LINFSHSRSRFPPFASVRSLLEAGSSPLIANKYRDTPSDLLSSSKPADVEIIEMLKEERGSQELFGQGDLVDESDLASEFGLLLFFDDYGYR